MKPELHIFGGGTFSYVRNHLALSAPAFGETARKLYVLAVKQGKYDVKLNLTKMADPNSSVVTNEDLMNQILNAIRNPNAKAIIFNSAVCDYRGAIIEDSAVRTPSGKYAPRLITSEQENPVMVLEPHDKIVRCIKPVRPDIKLVTFKTTAGASEDEVATAARKQMAQAQADFVLANDTITRNNTIFTLNETSIKFEDDRQGALKYIVDALGYGNEQVRKETPTNRDV